MDKIIADIESIENKLKEIDELLLKEFQEWSDVEKRIYGDHQQLRKEKGELRKEKGQLRKEKGQLLKKEELLLKKEEQLREEKILKEKALLNGNAFVHSFLIYIVADVNPSSFMDNFVLPTVSFEIPRNSSTTTSKHVNYREPKSVTTWEDFVSGALSFSFPENIESRKIKPPSFSNFINLSRAEKDVDMAFGTNLTTIVKTFFADLQEPSFLYTPENVASFKGIPDHLIYKNNGEEKYVYSFIEDKSKEALPTPGDGKDLVEWWIHDRAVENDNMFLGSKGRKSIYPEITQVYGYLSDNSLKYGILTNYTSTWFMCRPSIGTLMISPEIRCNKKSPTLLRCFIYFLSLLEKGHEITKSPESTPSSPRNNETISSSNHVFNTRASKKIRSSVPIELNIYELKQTVGMGSSGKVFRWTYKGQPVVVKLCDINQNKSGYKMMLAEVDVYERLNSIQGKFIPRIYFSGEVSNFFVICMDFLEGVSMEPRDSMIKDKLDEIRKELKSFGVVHDDIRKENIIVSKDSRVWLIDFGKCIVNNNRV